MTQKYLISSTAATSCITPVLKSINLFYLKLYSESREYNEKKLTTLRDQNFFRMKHFEGSVTKTLSIASLFVLVSTRENGEISVCANVSLSCPPT